MQMKVKAPLMKNFDSRNSFADAAKEMIRICKRDVSKALRIVLNTSVFEDVALTQSMGGRVSAARGVSESVSPSEQSAYFGWAGGHHDMRSSADSYGIRIDSMLIESDGRLKMLNPLTNEFIDVNPANLISMPPPLMSDRRRCG